MTRDLRREFAVTCSVLLLALAACGGAPRRIDPGGVVPDEARLRQRVRALYRAEQAGDWAAHRAIHLPRARRDHELETRVGMGRGRDVEIVRYAIRSVAADDRGGAFDEDLPPGEPAAVVEMTITTRTAGGAEKRTGQTDYWVRRDEEWYWTWRGWPSD